MKSGYVAPKGNFEKEKRIRAARLKSELSTPPRMAKIPAAMMELEARGVEVMHRFYSRETKGGEGNWSERVLDTSLSFRLDWVWSVRTLRPTHSGPAQTKLHSGGNPWPSPNDRKKCWITWWRSRPSTATRRVLRRSARD